MRPPEERATGEARRRGVQSTKTARFSSVLAKAGKPEIYLPLTDPKQDRAFMRAVKQDRVISVRQEPTSTRQPFGIVGFDQPPYTTYLVFKKPLTEFLDARIVGIDYDALSDAPVAASKGSRLPMPPTTRAAKSQRAPSKPAPAPDPPKREPEPKEFRVRVRITTVAEKDVTVQAMNKREATERAQNEVAGEGKVSVLKVTEA